MSGGSYSVGGIELPHLARNVVPDPVLRSVAYQMAEFLIYDDARGVLQEAFNDGALPSVDVTPPNPPIDRHNSATISAGTFLGDTLTVTIPQSSDHPSTVSDVRDSSLCIALQTIVDAIADAPTRTSIQGTITRTLEMIVHRFHEDAPHPWW